MTLSKTRAALERGEKLHSGIRHARFIRADVPLHVILYVVQGMHLLRPCDELNDIIVGVFARALQLYTDVELYAAAFLSNHAHIMLQGPPNQVPAFIGYVKREISYRWGHSRQVNRHGQMWRDYEMTALPTASSQIRSLRYVLSQGVKEGLVVRPQDWPGVHCARALLTGTPMRGRLLNATAYSRAVDAERRKRAPKRVNREDFVINYSLEFATLPAWKHLDEASRRAEIRSLIDGVVADGHALRRGRPPLGRDRIKKVPLDRMTKLPKAPWRERVRRLVCWASPNAPETRAYLDDYWAFQDAFRAAANAAKRMRDPVSALFPDGAHIPGRYNGRSVVSAAA